jgi:hypothetical protein
MRNREMSVASWAPNTYYLIGDIVNNGSADYKCIKVNLSSASNKPPNVTYWAQVAPLPSGIYSVVAGTTQVISIPGLTTSGVVSLTYIHPPGGGAGQWFKSSTPTANTLTVELGQTGGINETIVWAVAKL